MRKLSKMLGILAVGLSMVTFSSCGNTPSPQPDPDPKPQSIPVESISFELEKTTFYMGETARVVNLQVNPSNATNKKVIFKSNDVSVAKINNDVVEAVGIGSTYIVCSSVAYPTVTYEVNVDVIKKADPEVPISSITLELPREEMEVDETIEASVSVSPLDATKKDYELEASPENIVSIEGNKIKASEPGFVRLQAKSKSNSVISNSVYLEVKEISAKGINLSCDKTTLIIGESRSLTYSVIPSNAKDKEIAFKIDSGSTDIIEVSSSGVVKANGIGEDYAVAYMVSKPEVWNRVKFTVIEIPVTQINLYYSKTTLEVEEALQLTAEVLPENATFKDIAYKVESETNDIISVSSSGLVTAISEGKDKVICYSTRNPEVFTEIEFNVEPAPIKVVDVTQINLTASKTKLNVFEEVQLSTEVLPEDATNKAVTYSTKSGKTDVIEVSNQGLVKANAKGKDSVICKSVSNPEVVSEIEFEISEVEVESINVEKTSVEMLAGTTYQINATVSPLNATYPGISYKVLDRNDYSDKGERFESGVDYTCDLSKPFLLNDIVNIDIWFDELESTQKFSLMFGQGWSKYFGYYNIFSDGTLGEDYAGVSVSQPVEGMFRFTFDLSKLNKKTEEKTEFPDEFVDLIYIRGQWSAASGNIKVNTNIKSDIISVNSTGLVSAINLGEQKVRVYSTSKPSTYKDIMFKVTSNPNDPMGEDVFDNF